MRKVMTLAMIFILIFAMAPPSPLFLGSQTAVAGGEFDVQLDNPKKGAGGGLETEAYHGRIDHISMTRLSTDNDGTYTDVFYQDTSDRWHLGWQLEDGSWTQACREYEGRAIPNGASCESVLLGWDDGTRDNAGDISTAGVRLFIIFGDRGAFGYFENAATASWYVIFSIGSEGDWHTQKLILSLSQSSTENA